MTTFGEQLVAHFREQAARHPDRGGRLLALAARIEQDPDHPAIARLAPLVRRAPHPMEDDTMHDAQLCEVDR